MGEDRSKPIDSSIVGRTPFGNDSSDVAPQPVDEAENSLAGQMAVAPIARQVSPAPSTLKGTQADRETLAEPIISDSEGVTSGGEDSVNQIGRYRLIGILGQGAMGIVYLAHDLDSQRDVALKLPKFGSTNSAVNSNLLQRFYREARATGNLDHPNICRFYDVGQTDGKHYIAMAYVEGRSLADYLDQGEVLPQPQAAVLVRKLADALQHAHGRGIVHRDLKPANVMLDLHGEPIVMDFGLACEIAESPDIRITQSGTILGSPAYMSPEQADGQIKKIGPLSDLYSLGVILYELLTGQLPFRGSVTAVLVQILTRNPQPPSELRPDVDSQLESICLKMLAKQPSDRFASMQQVVEALDGYLTRVSPATRSLGLRPEPVGTESQPTNRAPASVSVVASLADKQQVMARQCQQAIARARRAGDLEQAIRFLKRLATSKSSKIVEFTRWAQQELPKFEAELERVLREGRERYDAAKRAVASQRYEKAAELLRSIHPAGRSPQVVALEQRVTDLNDEVQFLLAEVQTGLRRNTKKSPPASLTEKLDRLRELQPDDLEVQRLSQEFADRTKPPPQTFRQRSGIEPRRVALIATVCVVLFVLIGIGWLYRASLFSSNDSLVSDPKPPIGIATGPQPRPGTTVVTSGQESLALKGHTSSVASVAFSADGKRLASASGDKTVKVWDAESGQARLTLKGHTNPVMSVAFSADGKRLASASSDQTVKVWDATSGQETLTLKGHTDGVNSVAFSPDGKRLASGSYDQTVKVWDLTFQNSADIVSKPPIGIATDLQLPRSLKNSIGMELVLIEPGEFLMGSSDADVQESLQADSNLKEYLKAEQPQHPVRITQPFYMSKYEVTQAEYQQVMGTNPSYCASSGAGNASVAKLDTRRFPVEQVSWNEAIDFCNKLSKRDGLTACYDQNRQRVSDRGYRLPTEAEWEYACRAGTTTPFHFGSVLNGEQANVPGQYPYGTMTKGTNLARTTAVEAPNYPLNAFGLAQTHGNVWEWCEDIFDAKTYAGRSGVTNDPVVMSGSGSRVMRGGCWHNNPWFARSAYRHGDSPDLRNGGIGFRVMCSPGVSIETPAKTPPASERTSTAPESNVKPAPDPTSPPIRLMKNSIGMELVLIEPGEFLMGALNSEAKALPNEKPEHRVRITQPFYMGKYEVTQAEYQQVMGTTPSNFASSGGGKSSVANQDTRRFPVDSVSWNDAVDFCNRLSEQEGKTACYDQNRQRVSDRGYRLPSEAEWEYACRAGTTTPFQFGHVLNGNQANVDGRYPYGTKTKGTYLERPTAVDDPKYPTNAFGLAQMHGNAWEWCEDVYDENAYTGRNGVTTNPLVTSGSPHRVLRGGSHVDDPRLARSASRAGYTPGVWRDGYGVGRLGFRIVCSSGARTQ